MASLPYPRCHWLALCITLPLVGVMYHAATGWRYVLRCHWLALLFKHANCVGMAGCHTLLRKSHASRWEAWLFYVCLCYVCHPHRPTQTSVPTDADIRIDRRRHPHRPTQTSASTDADIRTDRRRWLFFCFTCAPAPRCRAAPCRFSASCQRSVRERGAPPSPLRYRHRG